MKLLANEGTKYSISVVPNPVTSKTDFEFNIAEEGNAEIQIYNSTGELVSTIASKYYSAGLYKVSFDAANLVNGVYHIVLSSNNQRFNAVMVVGK